MKSIEKNVVISPKRIAELEEKGEKYLQTVAAIASEHDYSRHESALAVIGDEGYQNYIIEKVSHLKKANHIILVGIGGSSLGVQAVFGAFAGDIHAHLLVLDAITESSPRSLKKFLKTVSSKEDVAIIVISKSGATTETITNGVQVLEACEKYFDDAVGDRTVFIGAEGTDFLGVGSQHNVTCLTFPGSIGGRFSVFTAVGIIPLFLLGFDVVSFREGAQAVLTSPNRIHVLEHAVTLALLAENGVHTVNFFTFNDRLRMLGFWYRQLLAESIGKAMTTTGTTFSHQLLPTVSTSADLHSMAQLYLGGYKGLYTHFVCTGNENDTQTLPDHWLLGTLKILKAKTPQKIKDAIMEGTLKAYDDQKLPYRLTSLDEITPYELGFMMSSLMLEVMALADLFNVDAFNQPNVESYKEHTRKILNP